MGICAMVTELDSHRDHMAPKVRNSYYVVLCNKRSTHPYYGQWLTKAEC